MSNKFKYNQQEGDKYPTYLHNLITVYQKEWGDWIPQWNSPEYLERLKSLNQSLSGTTPSSGANSSFNSEK